MGPYCDLMRHPCDFKPCENGGHCEIVGDLYYKCLCRPNFTGINCQIEIQPCNDFQCNNGGTCRLNEHGDAFCLCSSNFTGTHCENCKYLFFN
jgi:delta